MVRSGSISTNAPVVLLLAGTLAVSGCRAKQLGTINSERRADSVNTSWAIAAANCWPGLRDNSVDELADMLSDPARFRAAFPGYALLDDETMIAVARKPLAEAPPPGADSFHRATDAILTRAQATTPNFHADRNAAGADEVSADSLCVVHNGSPVGFK
jgi:hypothetical protein